MFHDCTIDKNFIISYVSLNTHWTNQLQTNQIISSPAFFQKERSAINDLRMLRGTLFSLNWIHWYCSCYWTDSKFSTAFFRTLFRQNGALDQKIHPQYEQKNSLPFLVLEVRKMTLHWDNHRASIQTFLELLRQMFVIIICNYWKCLMLYGSSNWFYSKLWPD